MTTVRLPAASVGGYGAVLARQTDAEVGEALARHGADTARLRQELAASMLRGELAFAELQRRARRQDPLADMRGPDGELGTDVEPEELLDAYAAAAEQPLTSEQEASLDAEHEHLMVHDAEYRAMHDAGEGVPCMACGSTSPGDGACRCYV